MEAFAAHQARVRASVRASQRSLTHSREPQSDYGKSQGTSDHVIPVDVLAQGLNLLRSKLEWCIVSSDNCSIRL